jgi:hypothetical protein
MVAFDSIRTLKEVRQPKKAVICLSGLFGHLVERDEPDKPN